MFYDHDTVWQDPIATVRRAETAGVIIVYSDRLFGAPASGSPYLVLVRSPFELS